MKFDVYIRKNMSTQVATVEEGLDAHEAVAVARHFARRNAVSILTEAGKHIWGNTPNFATASKLDASMLYRSAR